MIVQQSPDGYEEAELLAEEEEAEELAAEADSEESAEAAEEMEEMWIRDEEQ